MEVTGNIPVSQVRFVFRTKQVYPSSIFVRGRATRMGKITMQQILHRTLLAF